jgi:hypothetical protein
MLPRKIRERRNHESDSYPDVGSSLTEIREVTIETPTIHVLMDGTLIPSAMNTKETMPTTEIPMGKVIGSHRDPEFFGAPYTTTIAHAKWKRRDHHRDVVLESAIRLLTKLSSPWPPSCYL